MFRTEINVQKAEFEIDLQDAVLCTGSCFANKMGEKLLRNKFKALVNPFGVIFNPISIFQSLRFLIKEEHLVQNQGIWFHYGLHSDFSSPNPQALKEEIAKTKEETQQFLQQSKVLMITLGTAFVYELAENQEIVANCHRMPAYLFEKRLLNLDEILQAFGLLYETLPEDIKIVLTVSPVRHTRETLPMNSLSKAILRVACQQIMEQYHRVTYFPAYEILMDDLRDYRFYKEDMIHPNETAEKYIWDIFEKTYFNKDTQQLLQQWHKIYLSLQHRPFYPDSPKYQQFLAKTLQELKQLSGRINLEEEIGHIQQLILK